MIKLEIGLLRVVLKLETCRYLKSIKMETQEEQSQKILKQKFMYR